MIAPAAEIHALHTPQLPYLIESVNERWGNSQPIIHSCPKPTYSVGFKRQAFTEEQLDTIAPIVGDFIGEDQSLFMATSETYFLSAQLNTDSAFLKNESPITDTSSSASAVTRERVR